MRILSGDGEPIGWRYYGGYMICYFCRQGGRAAYQGDADMAIGWHMRCHGATWCDCQHKVISLDVPGQSE